MSKKITIKRLKNTDFPLLYSEFMTHNNQSTQQFFTMLSIAVVFINSEDELIKRLGYRIVVEYCNKTSDYKPLYEIAINYGLYPISEFIERHYLLDNERSFFTEWNDAFSELYKHDSIYLTNQQALLKQFADDSSNRSAAIIAPTSYGKTEQIMDLIRKYKGKKICIVTPNKALLTQTKYRIKQAGVLECGEHIIIHPEMYRTESDAVIAVFTQERLLRLLKTNPSLYFDCIIRLVN